MPTPETNTTAPKLPSWMETARRCYGEGFKVRSSKALADSNTDWGELPEHERSFALAHLLYLNLVAQRGTQRHLREVRDLLDEVVAGLAPEDDDEPDPDDDGPDGQAGVEIEDDGDAAAGRANEAPAGVATATGAPPTPAPTPVVLDGELIIPGEEGGA